MTLVLCAVIVAGGFMAGMWDIAKALYRIARAIEKDRKP